jgi:hypothetical protein
MSHRKQLRGRRVVHKSIGGILPSVPEPVDPVGNAARLKSNTVALSREEGRSRPLRILTNNQSDDLARREQVGTLSLLFWDASQGDVASASRAGGLK